MGKSESAIAIPLIPISELGVITKTILTIDEENMQQLAAFQAFNAKRRAGNPNQPTKQKNKIVQNEDAFYLSLGESIILLPQLLFSLSQRRSVPIPPKLHKGTTSRTMSS